MADAKAAEGEKRVKKKRPAKTDSGKDGGKKIPPTGPEAAAPKPGPVAEEGPVRYEGCGPCRRAVPDVPLSDAGRSSRDLLFLLFFVLWAIGDLVISIIGFKTGSPQALIYGLDFAGNVCGRKNAVRALAAPRAAHARPRTRRPGSPLRPSSPPPGPRGLPRTHQSLLASPAAPRAPLRSHRGAIPRLARSARRVAWPHARRTAAAGRCRRVGAQQPPPRPQCLCAAATAPCPSRA